MRRRGPAARGRGERPRDADDFVGDVGMREVLPVEAEGAGSRLDLATLNYRDAMVMMRDRATREYLVALMTVFDGNVSRAADRAGIARESLHRLLKRCELDPDAFRVRCR